MAGYAACAVVDVAGMQVTGVKTTQDGVEAARMCGIDSYRCDWSRSWSATPRIWMP